MSSARISFDVRLRQAVRAFWAGRLSASDKQRAGGKTDQGNRGMVTSGKTMDSFRNMIIDVVKRAGPKGVVVHCDKSLVVLPGFFRPTKQWDVLVVHNGRLLVAVELKSLCGPSFGNNATIVAKKRSVAPAISEKLKARGCSGRVPRLSSDTLSWWKMGKALADP